MSADIRLDVTFFQHRKTRKLQNKIGAQGVISLLKLWSRVAVEKPTGILVGWDVEDISLEAEYDGDVTVFVETLIDLNFLELIDGEYQLHNWDIRQPWVAKAEERSDTARMYGMAKKYPEIYKRLKADGVEGISKREYVDLTSGKRSASVALASGKRSASVKDSVALAPAPAPSPTPAPKKLSSTPPQEESRSIRVHAHTHVDPFSEDYYVDPDTGEELGVTY